MLMENWKLLNIMAFFTTSNPLDTFLHKFSVNREVADLNDRDTANYLDMSSCRYKYKYATAAHQVGNKSAVSL